MSIESMAIAAMHSRATGAAKLVLLGIANHDGDGGSWPSIRTLARWANVDERNVQRALVRLQQLGEIRVEQQAGGLPQTPDHRRPNRYFFQLDCPFDCDRTRQHRSLQVAMLDRVTLASPGGGSATPPGGGSATPPGGGSATRTLSKNHPLNQGSSTCSTTEREQPVDKRPEHECNKGWLETADREPVPCLVCKPHLVRR